MYTFLESEFAKAITPATGSLHPFLPALSLAASGNLRRKDLVEIEIQRLEEQEQLRSTINIPLLYTAEEPCFLIFEAVLL